MEMLRATVHLLHGQTDNSLTRIDRLFMDSDPKEGVGKVTVWLFIALITLFDYRDEFYL